MKRGVQQAIASTPQPDARAAGIDVDLHVFEALSHAGYIFLDGAPEQTEAYAELARFLHHHLRQTR